ncbi:MAG: hypothetical protein JWO97_1832, partial [Acidobacteria bacterium]|nr:hypothetical protein [Acidobacteriota bacterium]
MSSRRFGLALILFLLPLRLFAQQAVTAASVNGTVEDSSGAPIAGATVTMRNVDRNQSQNATTDLRGRFRFPLLAIGDYQLTASAPGLASSRQRLRLAIGAAIDLLIRLHPAQSETIDVTAAPPIVETHRT